MIQSNCYIYFFRLSEDKLEKKWQVRPKPRPSYPFNHRKSGYERRNML